MKEVLSMGMSGSPSCFICRTFIYEFKFQIIVKPPSFPSKTYRNPIFLAKEYKEMIDSAKVKNRVELAKIRDIPRARATQIMNVLKLY